MACYIYNLMFLLCSDISLMISPEISEIMVIVHVHL